MMSTPFFNLFFGQIRSHNKRVLRTRHKVSGPQTLGVRPTSATLVRDGLGPFRDSQHQPMHTVIFPRHVKRGLG
jgi:hypothetical protein